MSTIFTLCNCDAMQKGLNYPDNARSFDDSSSSESDSEFVLTIESDQESRDDLSEKELHAYAVELIISKLPQIGVIHKEKSLLKAIQFFDENYNTRYKKFFNKLYEADKDNTDLIIEFFEVMYQSQRVKKKEHKEQKKELEQDNYKQRNRTNMANKRTVGTTIAGIIVMVLTNVIQWYLSGQCQEVQCTC